MRPHLITSSASAWCEAHATPPVELRRQPAPPPASRARPPRASWLAVERPEQHRRLSRSVEHATVTLLRAPAGTGKTVLAADWASRRIGGGDPVAWMTMTERDNDPAVFWAHLREALALLDLSGPETGLPAGVPDAEHLDLLSARLLELGAPVALVVDAADRLRTRTIYDQLRALIEAADDRLRIVITSRTEPPLPIHRYRVEDRLTEFGADDLAMGADEVEQVLLRHRVPASAELIDEVLRRTEGWAVGVRLAALRLAQEGPGVDLAGFAAPYVREEILTELAPIERDVLTATAPVEELAPGLAPALTGRPDGDVVVHALARGNAFVCPVPGRPETFRLHPLVRELLLDELDHRFPGRSAAMHRRAAAWCHTHDDLEGAVRHGIAACDWRTAAGWVVHGRGLAEVIAGTPTGTAIARELRTIPESGLPEVIALRAATALLDHDLDGARAALDLAHGRPALATSALAAAWYDASGRSPEALQAARRARSSLETARTPDSFVAAVVAAFEGFAELRAGDLEAAGVALREAATGTEGIGVPLRLRCLAELAFAEAVGGRLGLALEFADAAERTAKDQGVTASARPVVLDLTRAWVALERQELSVCHRALNRTGRARVGRDDETWRTTTVMLRARLLRDRGELGSARRQLDQTASTPQGGGRSVPIPRWLRDQLAAEAGGLGAGTQGDQPSVAELLAHADLRYRDGDMAAARTEVGRALQLARPELVRRPFAHASPAVQSLIRNDARLSALAGWLSPEQLGPAGADPTPLPQPVLDALSTRELQVLRHLAEFLTTEEIAAEMYISVNTVRTHVRRVLEKLSVSRRHEAVRRGQQLGLV